MSLSGFDALPFKPDFAPLTASEQGEAIYDVDFLAADQDIAVNISALEEARISLEEVADFGVSLEDCHPIEKFADELLACKEGVQYQQQRWQAYDSLLSGAVKTDDFDGVVQYSLQSDDPFIARALLRDIAEKKTHIFSRVQGYGSHRYFQNTYEGKDKHNRRIEQLQNALSLYFVDSLQVDLPNKPNHRLTKLLTGFRFNGALKKVLDSEVIPPLESAAGRTNIEIQIAQKALALSEIA